MALFGGRQLIVVCSFVLHCDIVMEKEQLGLVRDGLFEEFFFGIC